MWLKKLFILVLLLFSLQRLYTLESDTIQKLENIKNLLQQNLNERATISESLSQAETILTDSNSNTAEMQKIIESSNQTISSLQQQLQEKDAIIASLQKKLDELEKQAKDQQIESEKRLKDSMKSSGSLTILNVIEGVAIMGLTVYVFLRR